MKKPIFVAIAAAVVAYVAGKLYQESRIKVEEEDTVSIDDVIDDIAKATDELMDKFEKQIDEFSKKVDDYLN